MEYSLPILRSFLKRRAVFHIIEIETPSKDSLRAFLAWAREVRVYGWDGTQRLPDFTLPYWRATLDAYCHLFDGTREDQIKAVQDFLVYEHEYRELGLRWHAIEGQGTWRKIFDLLS